MADELIKNLLGIVIGLLTAINTSILWQIRDLSKKHEQTLYGANGDNGMTVDMKLVRERTHDHLSMLTAHEMRLSLLEDGHPPKNGHPKAAA